MVGLNDFLFQILQPYFFYSVVFLSIAFVSVKIFLKFNPLISRRVQSILWLIPLLVPVTVLLLFHPQTVISAMSFASQISVPAGMGVASAGPSFLSFTGLLCIGGAVAAVVYFGFMVFFGRRIALKRFHVVMMAQDEYTPLQEKVKETAHKLGISEPKVGLVDDLLPNAFTVGYGQNTVVVFSLGLLNMLALDELTAVASHELAHVKAKDYLFKTTSYTLNILSFFNPLSYLAASQSQKERELLADQKGAALLDKPALMAKVLTKVQAMVQEFPKPNLADRLSSSLFLVFPLAHRPGILASHPQIAQRVQNIHAVASAPSKKRRYVIATALLLGILVCATIAVGYSTIQAQNAFSQKANAALVNGQSFYLYNESYPFDPSSPTGIFFANESSLQLFLSSLPQGSSYVGCYVDGNGITHTYTSSIPNIVVVSGQSVLVNGQSSFFGNMTYPFDPAHPTGNFVINQGSLQNSQQDDWLYR
jgi:Zn-dependent protease with chaperone function